MRNFAAPVIVTGFGLCCYGAGLLLGIVISMEDQKHPTYHCDGSTTMGYAVPGTPEAAACWIEGGAK